MTQRMPHLAGMWYPRTERECLQSFEEYERACKSRQCTGPLVGGIVPHAGWSFSGQIAYNVIREVARAAAGVDTVLLFGGHLHPHHPITMMTRGDFWTPVGLIPTDAELADAVIHEMKAEVSVEDPASPGEDNTVELQAPFIRHLMPDARVVVIKAPPNPGSMELARCLVDQAGRLERQVVILGSTDLSHYGGRFGWAPHGRGEEARRWVREENDRQFIEVACALNPEAMMRQGLGQHNACCSGAAAAAVECGRQLGASEGELLTQALSSDMPGGGGDSFVGYAGIVF